MTADQNETGCSLAKFLADNKLLTLAEQLRIVGQVADQVTAIHSVGHVHRAISATNVFVAPDQHCTLSELQPLVLLGGPEADGDLIPPDLRRAGPWNLPSDNDGIAKLLGEAKLTFDPRRIDLFQLGSLLCRISADVSIDDYLRSPRAKGQIPLTLRRVIDSALGLDPARRYVEAGEYSRDIALLKNADELGVTDAESTPDAHAEHAVATPSASAADTPVNAPDQTVAVAGSGVEASLPFSRLGHYRIEARIGCGGMGDVYRGFDESLQRVVAIKVLPQELARNAELVKRFYVEASSIAMLIHSNIIQIYFIGEDGGHHFFAMQFVDGESLGELLHRKQRLSVDETLAICEQCLAGLALAHSRGLVHRDIKPTNILLDRHYRRALLADFGLAKALDAGSQMTATGVIMGTLDYISPEQGRGLPVDGRSDLYSFGVLMYQALSGRVPFEADTATAMLFKHAYDPPPSLHEAAPHVPVEVVAIVERLLAKAPQDRYPTADALLDDLQAFRAGRPLSGGSAAEIGHSSGRPRHTVMFRITDLPVAPDVPEELLQPLTQPNWWSNLARRYQSMFRRQAPEFLKQLQSTQQQVDGAISDYERRVRLLESDIQNGESVLAELNTQRDAWLRPATSPTADADEGAREREIADLTRAAEEQENQLGLMRLNLSQARAKLLNLQGQRDLLNARLKAAHAGLHLSGGARTKSRNWETLGKRVGYVVLAAGVCVLIFLVMKEPDKERSTSASIGLTSPKQHTSPSNGLTEGLVAPLTTRPTSIAIPPRSYRNRNHFTIANADGTVDLYSTIGDEADLRIQKSSWGLDPAIGPISGIVYSHDGTKVAFLSRDEKLVSIFDTKRKEVYRRLAGHKESLETAVFSTDDTQLMTGGYDGVRVWDVKSGKQIRTIKLADFRRWPQSLAWSRDGKSLVVGAKTSGAPSTGIWDLSSNSEAMVFSTKEPASYLRFSYDETQVLGLAAENHNRQVTVWNINQAIPVRRFGQNVKVVEFSVDGRRVLTDGPEHQLILWNVETGKPIQEFRGHTDEFYGVAFSHNDQRAVSISKDSVRIWKLPLPDDVLQLDDNFDAAVTSVVFVPQGDEFYSASRDGQLARHYLGQTTSTPFRSGETELSTIAVASNGSRWLTTEGQEDSADNVVTIREGRETIRTLRGHQDRISSAMFSKDARQVVSGGKDGTIRVWDIQTEQEICQLKPGIAVNSVAFAPEGPRRCLSGGDENVARLWDLETQQELRQFVGHEFLVLCVAFTPDGQQAITGSADRTIRLWDVETGTLVKTLQGHTDRVTSIAVSPKGDFLLSGSDDASVRRWDLKTGQLLQTFTGHSRRVRTVAIAPDGARGISGSDDQTIRVWKLSDDIERPAPPKSPFEPTDMLQELDLAKKSVKGKWTRDGEALLTAASDDAKIQIANLIPDEYQVKFVAERLSGDGPLRIDLVNRGSTYRLALDANHGVLTTLEEVREMRDEDSNLTWNGIVLPAGRPHSVVCTIGRLGLNIAVDDRSILNWRYPPYGKSQTRTLSLNGSSNSQFRISEMMLIPTRPDGLAAKNPDPEQISLMNARSPVLTNDQNRPENTGSGLLKSAHFRVPQVTTYQTPEKLDWQRVRLNTEGLEFGAIRFTSTLDVPADLHWSYAVAGNLLEWQIIPAKGKMRAFESYRVERDLKLPNLSLPLGNTVVLQSLPGGQIKPGEEYFIWFRFKDEKPVDVHCALQLVPTDTEPPPVQAQEIAQHMGLPVPFHHVNQSELELWRVGGKHAVIESCVVSPDGKWILISDRPVKDDRNRRQTAQLLDYQTGKLVREFSGQQGRILWAQFTPDNRRVLIHDQTGNCLQFDVQSGDRLADLNDITELYSWNVTSDSTQVVGVAQSLGIWDLETGKRLVDFKLEGIERVGSSALVPNSKEIVVAATDGIIRILDLESGKELRRIGGIPGYTAMQVSHDGKYLATAAADDPVIKVWNLQACQLLKELKGHENGLTSLSFSPDGNRLLSAAGSGYPTEFMEFGLLKRQMVYGRDHSIRLWDVETGSELLRIDDQPDFVSSIQFSAQGKGAVSTGHDGTVRVWKLDLPPKSPDIAPAKPEHTFAGHLAPVRVVAFTPDGQLALSGGGLDGDTPDNSVRVWNVAQRTELRQYKQHTDRITRISIAPDGKQVLSASQDGQIQLWNLETLERVEGLPNRPAQYVKFAANGTHYVVGGEGLLERRGLQHDVDTLSFNFPEHSIAGLDTDIDGQQVLTFSAGESVIKVWDAATGRVSRTLSGHSAPVESISLASYGGQALSAGQDGTLRWWDTNSGRQLRYFKGHTGNVLCTDLSPNGLYALSGGEDGTVRLWDLKSGIQVWQGAAHTGAVGSVAFSPDGRQALSGGADRLVCLWKLPESAMTAPEPDNDREAATGILTQGGAVDVEVNGLSYNFSDKQAALPKQRFNLTGINLSKLATATDTDLSRFKSFAHVKHLNLAQTKVTDAGMQQLQTMATLEELNLADTQVTGVGLKAIATLSQLQTLNLSGLTLGEGGLNELQSFKRLRELTLGKASIEEKTIPALKPLQRLQLLEVIDADPLKFETYQELKRTLPFSHIRSSAGNTPGNK